MLPCQRHLFDIPDDVSWLNCAYMAPLLRSVAAAGEYGIRRKVQPWSISPPDFFHDPERARSLFAQLLNCDSDCVALTPSASYGVSVAARNLPLRTGETVVILEEQYPSNVYAWKEACRRSGAAILSVPRPAGDWTEAVIDAIDERTAVAALPQCHWTDGALIDLERVGRRCREAGAALVLDLTQSLGALPFDVSRVRPDFVTAAGYKWLLGPYSAGFLYAAPEHHQAQPIEYNWINRTGSEDFSNLVTYRDDYHPGARRFDMGERASFHLLPMCIAALEQILDWGVEQIAATLAATNREIAARARGLGFSCLDDGQRAGHFLGLKSSGALPPGLVAALGQRKVYLSVRGTALRITPHLYNNEQDVERLFDALEAIL